VLRWLIMAEVTNHRRSGTGWTAVGLLVGTITAGCGIIMIGEPVEEMDLANQDPAQKNLEAVRAMQNQPPPGTLPQPMTPPPPPLSQIPIERKPASMP